MSRKRDKIWGWAKKVIPVVIAVILLAAGAILLWASTLEVPSFESFAERKVLQSTKIYDRTGTTVLYNIHDTVKRKVVPFDEISPYIKQATIAIEDETFYSHIGIEPKAILRAVLVNLHLRSGYAGQGGSTLTQQVIKNVLLTQEQTLTRKIKEMFLALKLERELSKDQILELYLNESPYGGSLYGVEETTQTFFGKTAKDVSLAEAAYIAAIPQAPTRYSPYGTHLAELEARKNLVLDKMVKLGNITKEEAATAKKEEVKFIPRSENGIKAAHFSLMIKEYLEEKYGKDMLETGGLKIISTIDWNMQKKAEELVARYAKENDLKFNAHNAAMVGIDPKTGQTLVMVGSRDYFDVENDGNFNIALAKRQPGSSFKPIVYATAFKKGYTPETILFDVKTQFSTSCDADGKPLGNASPTSCYMPVNYDAIYRGPISIRNALAQSINIPAIQALYLVGVKSSLETARSLGITSLTDPSRYGLTLVLGGGEVSLLEMTGAYGVFANDGIRNPTAFILRVEDSKGNVLEEYKQDPVEALTPQIARQVSSVLSDNVARTPAFGESSLLQIPGRQIAVKTGTTNDYRDAWIIGYTPNIALGAWVGNNDNSSMDKKVAGFIVAPMWNAVMKEVLTMTETESFKEPEPIDPSIKPILRGVWQGGETYLIDKTTGKLATEFTPKENTEEHYVRDVHTILHWVNRADPLGPAPVNPQNDSQYNLWEGALQRWLAANGQPADLGTKPTTFDDVHTADSLVRISISTPSLGSANPKGSPITAGFTRQGDTSNPLVRAEYYVNSGYIGVTTSEPFTFTFTPEDVSTIQKDNELTIIVQDSLGNKGQATTGFSVTGLE